MIKPTAGHAELFGVRVAPGANDLWRRVGHLVESATAYPELTVVENLDVARRLAGIDDRRRVDLMIDRLALNAYAGRRAGTLSLGNLQRLALARALLHGPELLILDEPANGLDPAGVIEIRDLLRDLSRDEGVTVFMSSHILGEVDLLANADRHRPPGPAGRGTRQRCPGAAARPATGSRDSRCRGGRDRLARGRPDAATARRRATRTPRPDGP